MKRSVKLVPELIINVDLQHWHAKSGWTQHIAQESKAPKKKI